MLLNFWRRENLHGMVCLREVPDVVGQVAACLHMERS